MRVTLGLAIAAVAGLGGLSVDAAAPIDDIGVDVDGSVQNPAWSN